LNEGWTSKQAVGIDPPLNAVTLRNQSLATAAEAARAFGVDETLVYRRIKQSASLEEAIFDPVR
jgi:hypothetical protein